MDHRNISSWGVSNKDIPSKSYRGRILLFSYAFPPMQVQMTAAVVKPMAAMVRLGFEVDVLCADSFSPRLGIDDSLLPFAGEMFEKVIRLNPPAGFMGRLPGWSNVLSRVPDAMAVLHQSAYEQLMGMDLNRYDAVMTWSPFHSINPVMVRVKKHWKNIPWIAQFSDPWVGNPLEVSRLIKVWNRWHEPRTVKAADFIVHSSAYSLDLMMKDYSADLRGKCDVIPHAYNAALYPQRPKIRNEKIILRHVGSLYGRRTPEPLFKALVSLYERRKDLRSALRVELIGHVPAEMLNSDAAKSLPEDTVVNVPNVSYKKSLEKMYDADILLLIEADVRENLFLPSKLSDYLGADTPVVGIVPAGASRDALETLGCWHAAPSRIMDISSALEGAVDYVMNVSTSGWCDEVYKSSFSDESVARRFIGIVENLKTPR